MFWIIFGSIVFVLICVFLAVEYYAFKKVFYSPEKDQNNDYKIVNLKGAEDIRERATLLVDELLKIPYEDIYTTSYDKLKLHAYFYRNKDSNDYVLLFHGLRLTARRNFPGRVMDLIKAKKNVVLVDLRAHGLSEGHKIAYGKKEQYDVVSWVNYIKQEFGEDAKITLLGVSMGGTAVLGAADKLDESVKIVADSPYFSSADVIKKELGRIKKHSKIYYAVISLASIIYCHVTLKYDVIDSIHNSKNKILLIYGTADSFVPYSVIEGVFLGNKEHIQLELFDGVGHGITYMREPEKYLEVMLDFINK